MKKMLSVLLVFCFLSLSAVFATDTSKLYSLLVSDHAQRLVVSGGLGKSPLSNKTDDALQLGFSFDPGSFDIDLGGQADFLHYRQTLDDVLLIKAFSNADIGTSTIRIDLDTAISYTSHTLRLGAIPGFYNLQGTLAMDPSYIPSLDTFSYSASFVPSIGIGIGKMYFIRVIKLIELISKHLEIPINETSIRDIAHVMYRKDSLLSRYNENTSENFSSYYHDLAVAFNSPVKVLDLIFIEQSQRYAFESARYEGMQYGWQGETRLILDTYLSSTLNTFTPRLEIGADYANFALEERVHYHPHLTFGFSFADDFSFDATLGARLRYLPENYRWWVDAETSLILDTANRALVNLQLLGEFNYLFTPNFITYAGLEVTENFTTYLLHMGGSYRIF